MQNRWRAGRIGRVLLFCGLAASALAARADVRLPSLFGDKMVLQQGIPVPVWGKADPGESVTVSVAGQSVSTHADAAGKWRVILQPLKSDSNPVTINVQGRNLITLSDVLIGEVWVGSGQSNMQYSLSGVVDGTKEVAAANYPTLRLFTVKPTAWSEPLDDVDGQWVVCTPQTARAFSATLYFFGRDLQRGINQPVGLIASSWGATIIQSWTRWEVLESDPDTKKEVEATIRNLDDPAWVLKAYNDEIAKRKALAAQAIAQGKKPPLAIDGDWHGAAYRNRPASLYNAMIHPLLGFAMRGVVWYQGEFNTGHAEQYARLFPKMIEDWRAQWGEGDFPFLFVQLPNNGPAVQTAPPETNPGASKWAALREAQAKTLVVPDTGMAVTIDTSNGELHPKTKQPVGDRLSRLALDMIYGKNVACYGPALAGMSVEGAVARLKFEHTDGGLTGSLQGFAIAGADRKFVWADAKIDGDDVVASSPRVSQPVAVRYGWGDNPLIGLANKAGLPASPFRTDDWK